MSNNMNKIFPRLKANYGLEIYRNDIGKKFIGKMNLDIDVPDKFTPISDAIFEDILMTFIVDNGSSYIMLQKEFLENNPELTLGSLKLLSVNNLIREIGNKIELYGDPSDVGMITCGGNFEASIIFIPKIWEKLFEVYGPKIAFCIPANDILYVCKFDNKPAIEIMKNQIKEWFHSEETQGLISKVIYLKEEGIKGAKMIDVSF